MKEGLQAEEICSENCQNPIKKFIITFRLSSYFGLMITFMTIFLYEFYLQNEVSKNPGHFHNLLKFQDVQNYQ